MGAPGFGRGVKVILFLFFLEDNMRTSARNQFPGRIVSVEKGSVGAIVKIDTDSPCHMTAYITKEAAEDLGLKKGDHVVAIVKATEVMVGKE